MTTPEGWIGPETIEIFVGAMLEGASEDDSPQGLSSKKMNDIARSVGTMALATLTLHAENAELKSIINSDGSLETFDDHVGILRDAMHALGKINVVAAENERLLLDRERWKREAMEWRLGFDAIASIRCMLYDGQMNQLTIGESASWRPALAARAANTPATGEAAD